MQSNDSDNEADDNFVEAGEVHDSYPPVKMSAETMKRPHDGEEEVPSATGNSNAGVDSRKRHAIEVTVDSSLPSGVVAAASGNSTAARSGGNRSGDVSRFAASAAMTPQQQQYEQIRELLMQQSALRSSTEPLQQQHNLELLLSVQQQQQLERLLISNYPTGIARANELQRLSILAQLGRSGPITSSSSSPHNDQNLRRLLLDQQNGAGYVNFLDYAAPSMSSYQSSLEHFQQQQQQQQHHMNLLTSSTNMNSHRAAISNDLLLQELFMSQLRSTDLRNHCGSVAAINDALRYRLFANTIPTRTVDGSAHCPGRATSESFAPTSAVESNLRAAAAARLLSPRNKGNSSSSSSIVRSTDELDVDNEGSEERQQSNMSTIDILQQRLQDPIVVADRTREAVLSELLDTHAQQAAMGAFDRDSNNLRTSSMIQQLQQLHHERLLVASRDEELQSATLRSLLASNHLHNVPRARVTERATIHNSAVTTVPMDCDSDTEQLSKYQVLIRLQLEYFVSQDDDVAYSVQGRKKQIVVGQVGIRCRHCSYLPHRLRGRGAGYYPAKLSGVYQAAQNMATNHLNQHCNIIPAAIREELCSLRGGRHESSAGGGKQYWTNKCTDIGLIERDDGVYFC